MKWEDFRQSDNIDDRRGDGGGGFGGGGGLNFGGGGGLGIGTIIVLGLISWAVGVDPRILITGAEMVSGGRAPQTQQYVEQPRSRSAACASAMVWVPKWKMLAASTALAWPFTTPSTR
jgi:predicted metalloprotease